MNSSVTQQWTTNPVVQGAPAGAAPSNPGPPPAYPKPVSDKAVYFTNLVAQPAAFGHNLLSKERFARLAQDTRPLNALGLPNDLSVGNTITTTAAQGAAYARNLLSPATGLIDAAVATFLGLPAGVIVHSGAMAGYMGGNLARQTATNMSWKRTGFTQSAVQQPLNADRPNTGEKSAAVVGGAAMVPAMLLSLLQMLLSALPKLGIAGAGGLIGALIGLLKGTTASSKKGFASYRDRRRAIKALKQVSAQVQDVDQGRVQNNIAVQSAIQGPAIIPVVLPKATKVTTPPTGSAPAALLGPVKITVTQQ